MKIVFALLALVSTSAFAFDGDTNIRCEGRNSAGIKIGIDIAYDPAQRITEIATFVNEATDVVAVSDLGAPSSFLQLDNTGKPLIVGFKSFNDGLEEVFNVAYVRGSVDLSVLKIGAGADHTAVGEISCRAL